MPHTRQMRGQRLDQGCRQHRYAIARPFAVAHRDFATLEIDILDAQEQSLKQAHARAVEQTGDQPARAFELREQRANLILGEHYRNVLGPLCAHQTIQPGQSDLQDLAVKKQQCGQGLVLRRSGHARVGRKVRQESLNLATTHFAQMLLAMEQNEPTYPLQVAVFRPHAVVLYAQAVAYLIEQAWCRHDGLQWLRSCTNVQVSFPVDLVEESRT